MKEGKVMKLHIVMVEPEIPQNTGNIARTCAAIGAKLHLVHPLGFNISEKAVKRAGLDYWDKVEIEEHDSFEMFLGRHHHNPLLKQHHILRPKNLVRIRRLRRINLRMSFFASFPFHPFLE